MLILLTNYYPYYRGEEYIESEIKILAEKFDNIIVIPTLVSRKMEITREVPENVKVLTSFYENSPLSKIKSMIQSLLFSKRSQRKTMDLDSKGKLLNKLYNYYFAGRTKSSFDQIVKMLREENISRDQPVVLYSYWFHSTAKIAVDLKNEYFENVIYLVARGHGYDVIEEVSAIKFLPLREYLLKNVDNLFLVSSLIAESMQSDYPDYADKIGYKRLGTDKEAEYPIEKNNKFILVSCSGVRKVKRIDKIVDALFILDNLNLDIEWYHFGTGPLYDEIKELASKKLNNIKFNFMGHVSNDELIDWYKNNGPKAFINTSVSEGVPVSIMEAMSLGIPTIATNAGGTSEIVKDGINGSLLDIDANPEEIALAVENLYKLDLESYNDLENNAYRIWDEDFNSRKNYESFANLIKCRVSDYYDDE